MGDLNFNLSKNMTKKILFTDNSSLFYGKKDLLGFSFYYHLPRLTSMERKEISGKITNYKGVNYLLILIIENFSISQNRMHCHHRTN